MFLMVFLYKSEKTCFLCFYLQINVFLKAPVGRQLRQVRATPPAYLTAARRPPAIAADVTNE